MFFLKSSFVSSSNEIHEKGCVLKSFRADRSSIFFFVYTS